LTSIGRLCFAHAYSPVYGLILLDHKAPSTPATMSKQHCRMLHGGKILQSNVASTLLLVWTGFYRECLSYDAISAPKLTFFLAIRIIYTSTETRRRETNSTKLL